MNRGVWLDRARTLALTLVVFALAHNLVFLLTYGAAGAAALEHTGHGVAWTATFGLVTILAGALALAAAVRIAQLSRMAHAVGGRAPRTHSLSALARLIARAWPRLFLGAVVLFVGAENLEHLAIGLTAPGLSVLGSDEYSAGLTVFGMVSFVAALVDALYRWRRDILIARIAAARVRWARARTSSARPVVPWLDRRHGAITGHRIAGRAPPSAA